MVSPFFRLLLGFLRKKFHHGDAEHAWFDKLTMSGIPYSRSS
jgi:hypothetical protein